MKAPKVGTVRTLQTIPASHGWAAVCTAKDVDGSMLLAEYPVAFWAEIELYTGKKAGWVSSHVGYIPYENELRPAVFVEGFLGYQDPGRHRDFSDDASDFHGVEEEETPKKKPSPYN